MQNLADIEAVGKGIAGAFVATIYGVASSNLFFLPAGAKLKSRTQVTVQMRELMLEGVLSIVEGLNPKLIRTKLDAYLAEHAGSGKKAGAAKGSPAGSPAAAEG